MTHERSAWSRLLMAVAANEPVLPALRPHLQRLRGLIAEDPAPASRALRRRRAVRALRSGQQRNLSTARQKCRARRI